MTRLAHRVLSVGALRVLAMLAGLGTTLLLARWLGAGEFGRYAFAFSVASLMTLPFVQGLPVLAVREVSRAEDADKPWAVARMHGYAVRLLGAMLLGALCVVAGAWAANRFFGSGVDLGLMLVSAVVPMAGMYLLVLGAMLRGQGRDVPGHVPDLVVRPFGFLLLLCVLWLLAPGGSSGATVAMSANLVASLAAVFAAWAWLMPAHSRGEIPWRAWTASLLPLSTVAGMQLVNGQVGVVILGLLRDETEVGYYKIATTLALQTSFLLTVVNAVAAPRFAAAYRAGDLASVRALNRRAGLAAVAFGAVVFVAYAVAGRWAIERALGPEFLAAMFPMLLLSGAHVATLFAGSTNVLLNMIGKERIVLRAAMLALGSNIVLNLALVPAWGMTGAAMGTAVSLAVWRLYLSRQLAHVLGRAGSGTQ